MNIGQRGAAQRMAHLFCELRVRLQAAGVADANSYEFSLTQTEIAQTLAITPVHVNRTLRDLRDAGLIALTRKRLTIPNVARLEAYCDFDPSYLQLTQRPDGTISERRS